MTAPPARTHILVVENDPTEIQRIARHLDGRFVWDLATRIADADRKAAQGRPRVLLVSELLDGTATTEFVRRQRVGEDGRRRVVVSLTRLRPAGTEARSEGAGGLDLALRKPIDPRELDATLRAAWQLMKRGESLEITLVPDAARRDERASTTTPGRSAASPVRTAAAPAAGRALPVPAPPPPAGTVSRFRDLLTQDISATSLMGLFRR